jgi:hypothetical protein
MPIDKALGKPLQKTPEDSQTIRDRNQADEHPFWGSAFMRGIPSSVEEFNHRFGFDLVYSVNQPHSVDSDHEKAKNVVFIISRTLWFQREMIYCLYALYDADRLHGFIGRYEGKNISTLRELGQISETAKGQATLYDWLRSLIKASCDKI